MRTLLSGAVRRDARRIFNAALAAVDPACLVANHIAVEHGRVTVRVSTERSICWAGPTLVVGAGKAAARMAAGSETVLDRATLSGAVVVADGCQVPLDAVMVSEGAHPLPDRRGEVATRHLLGLVQGTTSGGILCLLSGGASSLLVAPRPPVDLQDKVRTTDLLLRSGAAIDEINVVRKHLSQVKGGGLLRRARVPMATLLLSDVIGDDPATIGSGPTAVDPSTYADAWAVLQRYDLLAAVPQSVIAVLTDGRGGALPETLKAGDPRAAGAVNVIVGSNRTALDGAATAAGALGWQVHVESDPLVGDSTGAAHAFAARLRHLRASQGPGAQICLLAGGETTVRVRGTGRGGRNQEFALALVSEMAEQSITVLSAGTDGIDGPTDAAGAFVDGTTMRRAARRGLDAATALADNDSYTFFAHLGDLFRCGPTGTNVMDIKVALLGG